MRDWKQILVKADYSIEEALRVLEKGGTRFVAVVDEDMRMRGSLTDGDVRRGLLRGAKLQDHVHTVMNSKPKTLSDFDRPKSELYAHMKENDISHLPLVDGGGTIVDILSVSDVTQAEKRENQVVLMAGGLGSRLSTLTKNCPKPLLKVGDKPILETSISALKEHGFRDIVISVNYKSEMIEDYFKDGSDWGVEISYLQETKRLGTAGALSNYKGNGLPFIVMNGDLLTKINFGDLVDFHKNGESVATMCLRQHEHQVPYGVVVTDRDRVLNIQEKPINRYFVNGGIYVLNPEVIEKIPTDTYYDMTTFFESLIREELSVGAYPFYEYWVDVGSVDDYNRAYAEFLDVFK